MSERDEIARVLTEHREYYDRDCGEHEGCECGWESDLPVDEARDAHRAHVVEQLEPLLARVRAEALREAADALFDGMGPDMVADSDMVYGEWLLARANQEARP